MAKPDDDRNPYAPRKDTPSRQWARMRARTCWMRIKGRALIPWPVVPGSKAMWARTN